MSSTYGKIPDVSSHNVEYSTTYAGQATCSNLGFASKVPDSSPFVFQEPASLQILNQLIDWLMINDS
jgi:hypothetical protein